MAVEIILVILTLCISTILSQTCSTTLSAKYPTPSIASGYTARIVAQGLTGPRSIIFDSSGHLLVVQQGYGLTSLSLNDGGGSCVTLGSKTDVIKDSSLNHGIEISSDGKTLYASNSNTVYSWPYDAANQRNTSGPTMLVTGMSNSDHTTRTLLLSKKVPGRLIVCRGSNSNVDPAALDVNSGHAQIKAFDITNTSSSSPVQFTDAGTLLGWGLRNSVGISEHPVTGGLFSVENSVDDITRDNQDIHEDNPGEELNFHGYLNGSDSPTQGKNYGYPTCFAAWNASAIPENNGTLQVGQQFAIGTPNATVNDEVCANNTVPPRLTFQAHWAPLDIKFNTNGSTAWVTSHGSWDRTDPIGYLVYAIAWDSVTGMPVALSNSTSAAIPILANQNNSNCPESCFRPVGLAFDGKGRLFMSSDSTGEIYVITKSDGTGVQNVTLPSTGATGTTGGAPSASSSHAAAVRLRERSSSLGLFGALCGALGFLL